MSIKKFDVFITPEDIYDKIVPEQRELFSHVKIINATVHGNRGVYIECLALDEEIIEPKYAQKLIGDCNIGIF